MPIISTIGRKQRRLRALIITLYIVLALGAMSMVLPFLVMVSTSFTSPVDQNEPAIMPAYFYSDEALYRKYAEAKYNEDIEAYNTRLGTEYRSFQEVAPPRQINERLISEWTTFVSGLPLDSLMLSNSATFSLVTPEVVRRYRDFLKKRFGGSLDRLNDVYRETNPSWLIERIPSEGLMERNYRPEDSLKFRDFREFKMLQPVRYKLIVPLEGMFAGYLVAKYGSVPNVNRALDMRYETRSGIRLQSDVPRGPEAKDWEAFVRTECPVHFVRLNSTALEAYRLFISRKYRDAAFYNRAYRTNIESFRKIVLPESAPETGVQLEDWLEFLELAAPVESIRLEAPEDEFRAYLRKKYPNVAHMNEEMSTQFLSFESITPPYAQADMQDMVKRRRDIRIGFAIRNYQDVLEYVILHGRPLINTAILCLGIMLGVLTVNPLCAYALSRYNLRSTYKILLFLLATMAFPAEVTAIPSFLLLKKFHVIGTYWAVILPGLANGYSIFLLKGFFDSLPKEFYEACILDGATELQMYWHVTIQLSKPVLAVIALGAFTAAYGSFMWAFLVLQDPRMWTITVWLYQMQMWAPPFLIYAGLVIAAIPTLLVFICCQNVIMRGIVVPSEK